MSSLRRSLIQNGQTTWEYGDKYYASADSVDQIQAIAEDLIRNAQHLK